MRLSAVFGVLLIGIMCVVAAPSFPVLRSGRAIDSTVSTTQADYYRLNLKPLGYAVITAEPWEGGDVDIFVTRSCNMDLEEVNGDHLQHSYDVGPDRITIIGDEDVETTLCIIIVAYSGEVEYTIHPEIHTAATKEEMLDAYLSSHIPVGVKEREYRDTHESREKAEYEASDSTSKTKGKSKEEKVTTKGVIWTIIQLIFELLT